jgi:hypothetical protein
MSWKHRIAITLGVVAAVTLTGALYVTLGLVDAVAFVAIVAVLGSGSRLRGSTRRAATYDRRATPQPDDVAAHLPPERDAPSPSVASAR